MDKINKRPIVFVANSSWYLYHYRKKLIKELRKDNHVITISPFDNYTKNLEEISLNILWKINQLRERNFIAFLKSLLRMILIIRTIKPKLIHSHTIKANLVIAFVSFIFDIPNVLSFTGLGRLSNGNIISRGFLKIILKIIFFLSSHRFSKSQFICTCFKRGYFIFQNPRDLNYFHNHIDLQKIHNFKLIYGSGIPKNYFKSSLSKKYIWNENTKKDFLPLNKIDLIYCGRLLKSKGIDLFIDIAKLSKVNNAYIYGSKINDSKHFLSSKDISSIENNYKNIKFMGNVKDPLIRVISKKPIIIVPSFYGEGISRSILEAMCLGIPVICSRNASVDVFTEEVVYIPNEDNLVNYIECLRRIITDHKNNLLEKKLSKAKKWCISYFQEETIVKQTKNIYYDLKK